jgi:hypothetical protein
MNSILEKDFVKVSGLELLLLLVSFWFLHNIKTLNHTLFELGLNNNALDLVKYNSGQPVHYFFYALFLELIIVVSTIYVVYKGINGFDVSGLIASILIIPINFYFVKTIFEAINNPILRAIILVVTGVVTLGGLAASMQQS